jgi:hypothetical protein
MVMTVGIALVAVIMMVMTTSGWRTVGMRAPTAMFVVAVIMLAFTGTASFIIIVMSLGRRQWCRQNQRASQKSCQGQTFRKFHLCSPSYVEHWFVIHAPPFIEIVQSREQPTCHRVFGPNPLILPRLIAWLTDSQPVRITCGERNCSMDRRHMNEPSSGSFGSWQRNRMNGCKESRHRCKA